MRSASTNNPPDLESKRTRSYGFRGEGRPVPPAGGYTRWSFCRPVTGTVCDTPDGCANRRIIRRRVRSILSSSTRVPARVRALQRNVRTLSPSCADCNDWAIPISRCSALLEAIEAHNGCWLGVPICRTLRGLDRVLADRSNCMRTFWCAAQFRLVAQISLTFIVRPAINPSRSNPDRGECPEP
jgi:hypothetical protein